MRCLSRSSIALLFLLAACGETERQVLCPTGFVQMGEGCVRPPDAGTTTATTADAALPDAAPDEDAGGDDAGPGADLGPGADALPAMDANPPDAGANAASISATTLDFGRVVVGATASVAVQIENRTAARLQLRAAAPIGPGAADFRPTVTASTSSGVFFLDPGQRVEVTVAFTPSASGLREASVPVELCDNACAGAITLRGEGVLEPFDCAPATIDYGFVNPGTCRSQQISCANLTTHPASIVSLRLLPSSSADFTLTASSAAVPASVAAGATWSATARYCPTGSGQDDGTAEIGVAHPNPARRAKAVILTGVGGGPNITCTPSPLSLGAVAAGQVSRRNLTCRNTGDFPLAISNVRFTSTPGADLGFTLRAGSATVALPRTVPPASALEIAVRWAPAAGGTLANAIEVASNDPDAPLVTVPVTGEAIEANGCAIATSSTTVDFGVVAPGDTADGSVRLTNAGTGTCGVTVVGLAPGAGSEMRVLTTSTAVSLPPGASFGVRVRFAPVREGAFTATLQLETTDTARLRIPIALEGTAMFALATVVNPRAVDFGRVSIGCGTGPTRTVSISNTDRFPATVNLSFEAGSSPAFSLANGMTAYMILPGGRQDVEIRFSPSALGAYAGRLRVAAMGLPPVFVTLTGEGAMSAVNTLTFPAQPVAQVDLLLVVDDSASMDPYQMRLATVAPILIARADASGADYHIGVTTTDPDIMNPGALRGSPRVVLAGSPMRAAELAANVMVGVLGSGTEEGLFAAAEAVTSAALLSGPNAGFLRPDGTLSVIILSDEEDQSMGTPASFVSRMASRPVGRPGAVKISTITGGATGCSGPNGPVDPTPRYLTAVAATGGRSESICDPSFAGAVTRIADSAFGSSRDRFQLGSRPAPNSVEVRVNGVLRPAITGTVAQWGVDYARAQVVFQLGRQPGPQDVVEVRWVGYCVSGTCGNGGVEAGEQCDDGNVVDTDGCLSTCWSASCGDGAVRAGMEQCDDGNTIAGDGCNSSCIIEGCGNGMVEPPEQCDDGPNNADAPNACRLNCRRPTCHDGIQDSGELCDDGNTLDNDGCVGQCITARCGDGFLRAAMEECDDGNTIDNDACSNTCRFNTLRFTVTSSAGVPLTLTPGGTPLAFTGDDDATNALAIGFPFNFLGTVVTTVNVSTNGFIGFEAPVSPDYNNQIMPSPTAPNALIAWWWDDLKLPNLSAITTQLVGIAPNRVRVISYADLHRCCTVTSSPGITAEIRLHETSNVIEVHYGDVGPGPMTTAYNASAGWESSMGRVGFDVLGCGNTCTIARWPARTVYRYTP